MDAEDFRRIALRMDGAEESSHMGSPDFRVGGRIFATLASASQGYGNLMLTPEQQAEFVAERPDLFLPIAGGWGRMGMTHIRLAAADEDTLEGALRAAWRVRVEKNAGTKRRRPEGRAQMHGGERKRMAREAKMRVVLESPPPGVDFGLQKGRGKGYVTIQKQRSGSGDLVFDFAVEVRASRDGRQHDFFGPLVQGPPGQRFIYIDIGTYAGQDSPWSRRLKVPLSGITSEILEELGRAPDGVLQARVPGSAKDGGPNCGTVRQFAGWKLRRTVMG